MILCCVSRVFKLEIVRHYIQKTRDISPNNKQKVFKLWDHIYKIRDISVNNIQVESVEVYVDEENVLCFENTFHRKYSPCMHDVGG